MEWRLNIIKADNGFILEAPRDESTDEVERIEIDRQVIEETYETGEADRYETDDTEKIAMARMLETVAEHFGMIYQKYDKNNLNIKFNLRGSKVYEEEDKA